VAQALRLPCRATAAVANTSRLFDQLSVPARERLRPYVELVHLTKGRILHDIDERPHHAFLPLEGMVSLMPVTDEGDTFEVATVCNDGFVGIPIVLNGQPAPYQAVVQIPGAAFRINGEAFLREFRRGDELQSLALAYVGDVMRQVVQSTICLSFHPMVPRLSRWLLVSRDCLRSSTIELTQEFIAQRLGLSRPKISQALMTLEQRQLIHQGHGRIHIVDPKGLESLSCDCYRLAKNSLTAQAVRRLP
jgi:CRP-like cAMP-binding protein